MTDDKPVLDKRPWRRDLENIPRDGSRVTVQIVAEVYYNDDLCAWVLCGPDGVYGKLMSAPPKFRTRR